MPTVIQSSWGGATPSSRNDLIADLCGLYGYDTQDKDLVAVALRLYDTTIKDLNTQLYEFNKVTESGIVMTSGQQWVILSDQVFKISQAYLDHNTDGDQPPLSELPWTHFKRLYYNDQKPGKPYVFSTFNLDSEQRVYLYYAPNDSTVNDYTLAVEYYKRIPLLSELGGNNSFTVPPEIENALKYGAQKRIAIHLLGAGHKDVATLAGLENEALGRLKKSDRTKPGQQLRFRLCDTAWSQR